MTETDPAPDVIKTVVDPGKLADPSPPDGLTNASVHQALTTGSLAAAAAELAAKFPSVHELLGELKALYETEMGKVRLDALDWHWQATNLTYFLKGTATLPVTSGGGKKSASATE
jgi:hypothetical protein